MNLDHLDEGNGTTQSANAAPAESAPPNPQPTKTRPPSNKSANPK